MARNTPRLGEWNGAPAQHRDPAAQRSGPAVPAPDAENADARVAALDGQFRAYVEFAPDAVVVANHAGLIALANRQAERLFGYARDELINQPLDLLMPEWLTAIDAGVHEEAEARPIYVSRTLKGRHRDGSELSIAVSLSWLPGDDVDAATSHASATSYIATIREVSAETDEEHVEQDRVARLQTQFGMQEQARWAASQHGVPASAEAIAEELSRLQALTDTALAHLALEDLLHELLARTHMVMEVEDVGILLMDDDGQHLTLRAARGLEDAVAAGASIPVGHGFSGRIAATRAPLIVNDVPSFETFYPQMRETQRSAMGVPLLVEGRLLGVLYVGNGAPRVFTQQDVPLLQRVADRIALAIDRARAYEAAQQARVQAEQQAEQLNRIFDAMADGLTVYDVEGRHVRMNAATRSILGLQAAPPEYFQLPLAQRLAMLEHRDAAGHSLAPEELPVVRALRGETLTGSSAVEGRMRTLDGRDIVATASAAPLRDQAGHIVGAVSILQDITERKRVEQALQESEARYRDLVESQTEMVCRYRPDGTLTFVNAAYCRHWGRSREELVGKLFLDLLPAAQAERARANLAHLTRHPDVVTDEHEVVLPDGSLGWQQWIEHAILDADGKVVEMQAIGRDISDRKRAEQALRESAERFRAAFESAAVGMMLVGTDGQLVKVNRPVVEMLGYSEEELRTHRFADFTHPDDQEPNQTLFRQAIAGKIDSYQLEKRFIHKQGHVVWGRLSAGVVRDAAGQALYLVSHLEDITEHNRLERERAEQAELLDRVFEAMGEGVAIFDAQGNRLRENSAVRRLLEVKAEASGSDEIPWPERFALFAPRDEHGSPLDTKGGPITHVLRDQVQTGSEAMDVRVRTQAGRDVDLTITAAPLRNAAGELTGAVAVYHDQTERRQLAREREGALRRSEEWFRSMADTAPVLLWVAGTDAQVSFVNAPWLHFTGRTLEQESGTGWADGIHPDDYKRCLETYLTAFRSRQSFTIEYRLRRFDGQYRWLMNSGVPRVASDGSFLGFIGSAIDISERKELEQEREAARTEAEQQAELLDRMFQAITDGLIIYDAHGRVVRANATVRSSLVGDSAPPDYLELPHSEQLAVYAVRDTQRRLVPSDDAPLTRALRGEVLTGSGAVAHRLRAPDGREAEFTASAAPLRDREGQITGAILVLRDETERNRLERERVAQAEQLDRIFEAMADAVIVYDDRGRTVRTNKAAQRLIGLEGAPPNYYELIGDERVTLFQMRNPQGRPITPEAMPSVRALRGEVLTGANSVDLTSHMFHGREVDVNVSAAPLRDPDGRIVGAVAIMRDQTERTQLLREREQARTSELATREVNQRLDTFFTMAAHDLRQPVAVSKLAVQTAQLQVLEAAKTVRSASGKHAVLYAQVGAVLERADQSLNRLWRLLQQLLDVSQAREGTLLLDRKPCSLDELLRQGVKEQQQLAPARALTLELPDTLPVMVSADATRLSQVLANYISNAVRYTPEEQPIAVGLRVEGVGPNAVARVEVRDRGAGIPPEDREKIWARFQRARTVAEAGGGLGLGLYIARLIVGLHGGAVGVQSEVGHGSTFWFMLPLATDPPADVG